MPDDKTYLNDILRRIREAYSNKKGKRSHDTTASDLDLGVNNQRYNLNLVPTLEEYLEKIESMLDKHPEPIKKLYELLKENNYSLMPTFIKDNFIRKVSYYKPLDNSNVASYFKEMRVDVEYNDLFRTAKIITTLKDYEGNEIFSGFERKVDSLFFELAKQHIEKFDKDNKPYHLLK